MASSSDLLQPPFITHTPLEIKDCPTNVTSRITAKERKAKNGSGGAMEEWPAYSRSLISRQSEPFQTFVRGITHSSTQDHPWLPFHQGKPESSQVLQTPTYINLSYFPNFSPSPTPPRASASLLFLTHARLWLALALLQECSSIKSELILSTPPGPCSKVPFQWDILWSSYLMLWPFPSLFFFHDFLK